MKLRTLLLVLLWLASGCFWTRPETPEYPSVVLESGLVQRDLVIPEKGSLVAPGDSVAVHFELRLADGTVVESSRQAGEPLRFRVGDEAIPRGLSEGLEGMRLFGRRILVIPPSLGYGPAGLPPTIPPDATLTFDIELMEHGPAR